MTSEPLASLIASLPEEERVVLTLHYVRGMTSAQIAELLSVPVRAVEGVLESGKRRLQTAIGLGPESGFPPAPTSEG